MLNLLKHILASFFVIGQSISCQKVAVRWCRWMTTSLHDQLVIIQRTLNIEHLDRISIVIISPQRSTNESDMIDQERFLFENVDIVEATTFECFTSVIHCVRDDS